MHRVFSIVEAHRSAATCTAWEGEHIYSLLVFSFSRAIDRNGGFRKGSLSHLNGVQPHGFESQEAVLPELWVDPEVVYPVRGRHVSIGLSGHWPSMLLFLRHQQTHACTDALGQPSGSCACLLSPQASWQHLGRARPSVEVDNL